MPSVSHIIPQIESAKKVAKARLLFNLHFFSFVKSTIYFALQIYTFVYERQPP
jgi:hypothetical protein